MNVLVIAAHPDDEVLGCGGTIASHLANGDTVDVLFMSEGVTGRSFPGQEIDFRPEIKAREDAAVAVANLLGTNPPAFFRKANLRMRDEPLLDIVKLVEVAIANTQPSIVYTHHGGDLNSDHRVTHEAVMTACRPLPGHPVRAIHCFEIPSSTEWSSPGIGIPFLPNRFVDISSFLDIKLKAIRIYDQEMRPFPHPRSHEALTAWARKHGASVGRHAAEAFVTVRDISG